MSRTVYNSSSLGGKILLLLLVVAAFAPAAAKAETSSESGDSYYIVSTKKTNCPNSHTCWSYLNCRSSADTVTGGGVKNYGFSSCLVMTQSFPTQSYQWYGQVTNECFAGSRDYKVFAVCKKAGSAAKSEPPPKAEAPASAPASKDNPKGTP